MSPIRLIILIGAAVAAIAAAFLVRNLAQAPAPTIQTEQQTVVETREGLAGKEYCCWLSHGDRFTGGDRGAGRQCRAGAYLRE